MIIVKKKLRNHNKCSWNNIDVYIINYCQRIKLLKTVTDVLFLQTKENAQAIISLG